VDGRLHRLQVDYAGRSHDLRAVCHPSESMRHFATRLLAYVLHYAPGLVFSRGVCIGEEPALFVPTERGRSPLWIDVGRPSRKKITRGLKRAERVIHYGYGNPEPFRKILSFDGGERLQVFWLATALLEGLAASFSAAAVHWCVSLEGETVRVNEMNGTRMRLK